MERLAGRIVLLWGWRRRAAAFAAGALAVLAQPPFDFFAACFISFPVLVWLLDGAAGDGGRGFPARLTAFFATGWWFGFGYFLAGLWWIGAALLVEADAHAWAMPFAVLGLPAVLALFFGLACALARPLWRHDLGRIRLFLCDGRRRGRLGRHRRVSGEHPRHQQQRRDQAQRGPAYSIHISLLLKIGPTLFGCMRQRSCPAQTAELSDGWFLPQPK